MFKTCYDDAADKEAAAKKVAEEGKTIHLTQDELNTMMSENRKKLTKQNEAAMVELNKLKESSQLTSQQKIDLELKISELEEQFLSKDELDRKNSETAHKKHQQLVDSLTTDRDNWKQRYSISTTERSLQDAAIAEEAISPNQIVAILGQNTHLVEVINDSGDPSGVYVPTVKFNDVDEEGKSVINDLEPLAAVKRMKELTSSYGNLFKGTAKGGVGGEGGAEGGDGSQPKLSELMGDPVKYAKWRKDNPELDTSKLRR